MRAAGPTGRAGTGLLASLRVALVALPLALVGGARAGGPPELLGPGRRRQSGSWKIEAMIFFSLCGPHE